MLHDVRLRRNQIEELGVPDLRGMAHSEDGLYDGVEPASHVYRSGESLDVLVIADEVQAEPDHSHREAIGKDLPKFPGSRHVTRPSKGVEAKQCGEVALKGQGPTATGEDGEHRVFRLGGLGSDPSHCAARGANPGS